MFSQVTLDNNVPQTSPKVELENLAQIYSKKILIGTFTDNDLEKIKEFLVVYVDRVEGIKETKKRNIFCFPIDHEKSPLRDFELQVEPYRIEDIDWLAIASDELRRIDHLQDMSG